MKKINHLKSNNDYCKLPLTNLTVGIAEGINKLRIKQIKEFDYDLQVSLANDQTICLIPFNDKSPKELQSQISVSQIQLFLYAIKCWQEIGDDNTVTIKRKDYLKFFKMVSSHHKNNLQFKRDLEILSHIEFQIIVNKHKGIRAIGNVLSFEEIKNGTFKLVFSDWIDHISKHQYTLVDKQFFSFHARKDWFAIMMLLKLSQLSKMKLNTLDNGSIKISTLLNFLGINHELLMLNGMDRYYELLSSSMNKVEKVSNFQLSKNFVKGEMINDVLSKGIITFKNPYLRNHYYYNKSA
ncbi:RepB family plasmid replication initiator protein [Alkalibacillus haloalkaliphilus]|uniref:RepB family plasmid replication initiator protein n=1 Tax=Alkalibacillus haloalkaliphilus TaxID=94136 RepID=UPI002936C501|nr:RepB family plasmid replication initiator protein [Alkalibacillus haloalkaliphilus]MDV2581675.1 hypothetical protein [Alkalibacillus haloalkaliphilus]